MTMPTLNMRKIVISCIIAVDPRYPDWRCDTSPWSLLTCHLAEKFGGSKSSHGVFDPNMAVWVGVFFMSHTHVTGLAASLDQPRFWIHATVMPGFDSTGSHHEEPKAFGKVLGVGFVWDQLEVEAKIHKFGFLQGWSWFLLDIFDVGYLFFESRYGGTTSANGSLWHCVISQKVCYLLLWRPIHPMIFVGAEDGTWKTQKALWDDVHSVFLGSTYGMITYHLRTNHLRSVLIFPLSPSLNVGSQHPGGQEGISEIVSKKVYPLHQQNEPGGSRKSARVGATMVEA